MKSVMPYIIETKIETTITERLLKTIRSLKCIIGNILRDRKKTSITFARYYKINQNQETNIERLCKQTG